MATAAAGELAEMRRGAASAFSVELTARADNLRLDVAGVGPVAFPVTAAQARRLRDVSVPARFGRGEETLTDPEVRDTWEVPKQLVTAEWNETGLAAILALVKEELGLPQGAELTADLHSLLVYEKGQHFLAHQDSEKDDAMVGTLVVALPSRYTGGELVVEHNGHSSVHPGSRTALSLTAFYADCRHEVRTVRSGYRVALTYNLLLHGDTSRPSGEDDTVATLAELLREHFSAPVQRYSWDSAREIPRRLVYLLDHEYTPRALGWSRLKGVDSGRVALLRAAAEAADCEAVLALADIRTTHDAYPADEYDEWYDDEETEGRDGDHGYVIQELLDSEIALTDWRDKDGSPLTGATLHVDEWEICASTATGDLRPYTSAYEGYMGNWGNTLDRWYHRGAVVVWPRRQAFANRAEASPAWALDEIAAMGSSGDVAGARAAAKTLEPFWETALRSDDEPEAAAGTPSGLLGRALRAADAVADPRRATMLVRPFRVEALTGAEATEFAEAVGRYGQQWAAELLSAWCVRGRHSLWGQSGGSSRPLWMTAWLPSVCARLHSAHSDGAAAAQHLLDLMCEWLRDGVRSVQTLSQPSHRDQRLRDLGGPLAATLAAATGIGAAATRDAMATHLQQQGDAVTTLELAALRAATEPPLNGARDDPGLRRLAADCAARLRARRARPRRNPDDWSIALPGGCNCDLCDVLGAFLTDQGRRTLDWPLAKSGRQHVHRRIDNAELPVTHTTRRQGRPFTLVLTKTDALFTRELAARATDEMDVEWLGAEWKVGG